MINRMALLALLLLTASFAAASNNLYFAHLKYSGGNWDPEPFAWSEICDFLVNTTNIRAVKEPVAVTLRGKEIYKYPVIVVTGDSGFEEWSSAETETLKRYFDGGGICIIDDSTGLNNSAFQKSITREFEKVFPGAGFTRVKESSALFFSFYLKPGVYGSRQSVPYLSGIERNNQLAVIFSHNDLFGIWEKDKLGNWFKDCVPGGEFQRFEAMKLTVNIFMYALTGTYKLDAIHTEYIKKKLEQLNLKYEEKK
ncbi:MAG: DUF4159 domain-containing protein [Candidatus Firestonebacteria bacterium]